VGTEGTHPWSQGFPPVAPLEIVPDPLRESGGGGICEVQGLDNGGAFLSGARTKGLPCPCIRIGWTIAGRENVETPSKFSSFGMGAAVSPRSAAPPSCSSRDAQARVAVERHLGRQRARQREAFEATGRD
jgi:hypothetical protein